LTTPVIRCIKEQKPEIEIHYITKRPFKGILENNPFITKIHTIEKDVKEIADELKKENFDFVIDLHNNIRSLQTKKIIGKPSYSFKKLNFKKWKKLFLLYLSTFHNTAVYPKKLWTSMILSVLTIKLLGKDLRIREFYIKKEQFF
jgi:ADP-heptose:LPS heptosyltransferase